MKTQDITNWNGDDQYLLFDLGMGQSKQVHSGIIHAKHEFFCRFPMFSWIIFLIHAHFFGVDQAMAIVP